MSFVVYRMGDSDKVPEFDTKDEAEEYCLARNHPLGMFYRPNNYHHFQEIGEEEE